MYKTLLKLMEDMKPKMTRKNYNIAIDDICDSEHSIFMLLRNGLTMIMNRDTNNDLYKKLISEAVYGMNNINSYCQKFNYNNIFNYNEKDEKSILKCAFDFHDSFKEYNIEKLENEVVASQ